MNNQFMTLTLSSEEEGLVLQVAFHAESHHRLRLTKDGPSLNSSGETRTTKLNGVRCNLVQMTTLYSNIKCFMDRKENYNEILLHLIDKLQE